MSGDAEERIRPLDFMILGAQKAGTSWLHDCLRGLPGLWLPADKDDEFFSYPGETPVSAFNARFESAPQDARIGDACASYFWTTGRSDTNRGFARDLPAVIDSSLGPGVRYIVLLRDPVERALSGYLHHVAFGSLEADVALLEAPASLGLVDIGRYGAHLASWLDRIGPHRILVRPAPGEIAPGKLLNEVAGFLGVDAPGEIAEDVVFPGLRRWRDDAGVWVALSQPGVGAPVGPARMFEGQPATLLIDAATIAKLVDLLQPDTERLANCLERLGWVDPAYLRWPTWPSRGRA